MSKNNEIAEKLKTNVKESFERIRKAIDVREKLLLRQIDVVLQQSHHQVAFEFDYIKFVNDSEDDVINNIRTYGKYNIDNFNIILKDLYENEDYILPLNDHDLMHKSCLEESENPESEEIVVEFFNNKSIIKNNADLIKESIINMTLNETKELINQSQTFNIGYDLDVKLNEEVGKCSGGIEINDGSILVDKGDSNKQEKWSQTDDLKINRHSSIICAKSSEKKMKNISNVTVNSCGGGKISLKNISNLTINQCKNVDEPKEKTEGSPECSFYKRLITENKLLKHHIIKNIPNNDNLPKDFTIPLTLDLLQSPLSPQAEGGADGDREHTKQIQQWLKQIIYETETEEAEPQNEFGKCMK